MTLEKSTKERVPDNEPLFSVQEARESSRVKRIRLAVVVSLIVLVLIAVVSVALLSQTRQQRLPNGFPAQNELPLVSGEVLNAKKLPGSQFEATVGPENGVSENNAVDSLLEAGYRVIGVDGSGPIGAVTSLSSKTWSVRVEFAQDANGRSLVKYLAAPRPGGDL